MTVAAMNRMLSFAFFSLCASAWAGGWDVSVDDFPRRAGEADDAARIQRAIDAAPDGVVYFPRGEYQVGAPIVVTNMCSLEMNKGAVLKATREMDFVLTVDNRKRLAPIRDRALRDYNLFVRGGRIDGDGKAGCLTLYGFMHFTVSDMTFLNGKSYGFRVNGGCELIANNLYFRCLRRGLAGNVALFADGSDSHFTDCVIVDYTVGVKTSGHSNRFTRCHVWGGLVPPRAAGGPCEMLDKSVGFWACEHAATMFRDCYADTAQTGFLIDAASTQMCGCWYFNNAYFKLDGITVIDHRRGKLWVSDGRFSRDAEHVTFYRSADGNATAAFHGNTFLGFNERPGDAGFKPEARYLEDQACEDASRWECLGSRAPFRFASKPGEFSGPRKTCRTDMVFVSSQKFCERFPHAGPGRTLVVRARATQPQTKCVELALIQSDDKVWGLRIPLTADWRELRVPLSDLKYFSHWGGLPPIEKGETLDVRKLQTVRFCFGKWLCPESVDKAHGFEVSSVRIEQ